MTRFGARVACVVAGTLAGYFALPDNVAQSALAAIAVAAGVIALVRAVLLRALVWGLLGAALLSSGLGEATWAVYEAAGADPFPSAADAFYLAAYPTLGLAILLLVRRHVPGGDRASMIDASIVAAGASALAWVVLGAPYLDQGGSVLEISVALAYPLGDLLVLGFLCRLLLAGGGYPQWVRIFAVAMVGMLVADAAFLFLDLRGAYEPGNPIDAGWIVFYLLGAAAACHHSAATQEEDAPKALPDSQALRLGLLAVSVMMAPLVLLGLVVRGNPTNAEIVGMAVVNVALLALVLLRVAMLLRERTGAERERAAQAAMLRSVIASSQSLVYIKDLDGRYVLVNEAFEEAFGLRGADLLGHTDDLIEHEQADVWRENDRRARRGAHSVVEHSTGPRGERTYESTKFPLYDKDGVLYATGGVSLDVTAYRRATSELVAARDEALAATAAKSAFLAAMSHEIRTPMNAVIGMTGLLMDTPLTEEQRDFLQTVRTSGDALLDIINNILDYSKIEVGELQIEHHPFLLAEVVEDSLDLVSAQAAAKGLILVADVSPTAPRRVNGDVTRVRQVLVNLLSNAVKFTEAGQITVTVDAKPAGDGFLLQASVADTGIGIPADAIPRLFRAFTQVDESTTRVYGGTGLGLVISLRLAAAMGGSLEVESEAGVGSTFHFTALVEACAGPTDALPPFPGTHSVLLVEPNDAIRRVLRNHLEAWGMHCGEARTAVDALAQGAARSWDLVLLDHHLRVDGSLLAAALRAVLGADAPPLVALTGIGSKVASMQSEYFADSLSKPVRVGALRASVGRALGLEVQLPHQFPRAEPVTAPRILRILLVEDNVVNQKVARLLLTKMGHVVDTVGNGQEALAAVHARPYDVVLMDVQMPVMDGLEATRRIRAELPPERQPRILAMTASALVNDRDACTAAGMNAHLSKPVRAEELMAVLLDSGADRVIPAAPSDDRVKADI
jgi:PAS domain S-box-containing protein